MSNPKTFVHKFGLRETEYIEKSAYQSLQSERDALRAEVEDLRWFANQINQYVLPGEADTQGAALILFNKLKSEIQILRRGLEKIRDAGIDLATAGGEDCVNEILREADKLAKGE